MWPKLPKILVAVSGRATPLPIVQQFQTFMDGFCKWGQGNSSKYFGIQKEENPGLFIKVLVRTLLSVMKLGFLLISIKILNWWVKLITWNCIVSVGNNSLLINLTVLQLWNHDYSMIFPSVLGSIAIIVPLVLLVTLITTLVIGLFLCKRKRR